jgi:Ni/Fe-hydrogenase subunit HybB-like protein
MNSRMLTIASGLALFVLFIAGWTFFESRRVRTAEAVPTEYQRGYAKGVNDALDQLGLEGRAVIIAKKLGVERIK